MKNNYNFTETGIAQKAAQLYFQCGPENEKKT